MILDVFFNAGLAIINFFLYPLLSQPDVALDDGFVSAVASLMQHAALLNDFGRVMVVLFFGISFVILIELAIAGYKGIMWIIRKIPFLNLK